MAKVIKEPIFPECPIRNVLARICDKWSMLVIFMLEKHQEEPVRFNALRRLILPLPLVPIPRYLSWIISWIGLPTIWRLS